MAADTYQPISTSPTPSIVSSRVSSPAHAYPPSSPEDSSLKPNHIRDDSLDGAAEARWTEEFDDTSTIIEGEDRVTRFILLLVGSASIAGFLFGYDTGVISGTLISIGTDLGTDLSDWQKEKITSATTLGALIGGLSSGTLSDLTGRKPIIALANIVFIFGAIFQATCGSVSVMILGRGIVGLGVGLASCIVPVYIGELAPTLIRGKLVTVNVVFITLGQLSAYAIGAWFQHLEGGWRWMVGLGAVPAIIQLVSLGVLPESPRILLQRSQVSSAKLILSKIYPHASPDQLNVKIEAISMGVHQSTSVLSRTTWQDRAKSLFLQGANRRALIIGSGLQASQQLCGFNTLMYYSASIFSALGFKNATAVGCLIAGVNFLFTLVALRIVDPFGRRRTMLYTLPIMVLSLFLSSYFFYQLTIPTSGVLIPGETYSPTYSTLILSSMTLYVSAYATGLGNIPWQQGELFHISVRGLGTSICTAVCWSCNLLIASTFLTLIRVASPSGAFAIYAVCCAISWFGCYLFYPETSGLSLEEVCVLFANGFGVEESLRLKQERG